MKKWPLKIINYLTGFIILSSVHCTVVALVNGGDRNTFLYSLIYLPIIILLSESQKRAKYFWQFVISAIVSLGMVHFINYNAFERSLSIVLTVAAIAIYFYARAKKMDCILETPEYYFLAVYLIMYFLERQYPSELLKNYAVIGAGAYCLLCMYKINIYEMHQVIDVNEELDRFPENRLLKSNLLMMGFQTIIVSCGMGIILSTGADGLLDKVSELIRRIFSWVLSFLESDVEYVSGEASESVVLMPAAEAAERSELMELILKILDIFAWMFVIALTLFVLYRILKKLYQLYLEFDMNSAQNGDEIERIYTVQSKEEKTKLKHDRQKKLAWDRSPNARIRKSYKKRVLKDSKELPGPSMTPEEIEQNIKIDDEDKRIVHAYYEKARYGKEPCTKDDMEKCLAKLQ